MTEPLIYLACPYAHPSEIERAKRIAAANAYSAKLFDAGFNFFSPLSHGVFSPLIESPGTHDQWLKLDKSILAYCTHMIILSINGWDQSKGVREEIDFAYHHGKPIFHTGSFDYTYPIEEINRVWNLTIRSIHSPFCTLSLPCP